MKNSYGTSITVSIDQILILSDREEHEKPVRYSKEYEIQYLSEKNDFKNHIIIFGPKNIDSRLIKVMSNYLKKSDESRPPHPLRLIKVDLKSNMDSIMNAYPDLQHFCIKDIPDDRTKDVIVKGSQLEQTDLYDRFVKDVDTSGLVNFLGIPIELGKIVYVGSDGSVYSRFNFKGDEKVRVVYELYTKFKKLKALVKPLDDF